MNVLSLFSGIGGIDVAVKLVLPGAKTVAYVERDKYCQVLLKARMNDGSLDTAPIIDDVRDASVASIPDIDIIIGGFPCQPFSFAGLRKENDERNLWPEFNRTIRSIRPRYVFLENVPGILTSREHEGYIFTILKDLNQGGYDAEWGTIKASDVGASHKRERWFCLAWRRDLADTDSIGHRGWSNPERGTEQRIIQPEEQGRSPMGSETEGRSRTLGDTTGGWTGELQDKIQTSWTSVSDVNSSGTSGTLGDTGDTSPEHGVDRHRQTQEQDEHQLSFAELTGSDFQMADPTSERGERWRTGIEGKYTQSEEGVSGWSSARELADTISQRTQGSASGEHSAEQWFINSDQTLVREVINHEFPPGPSDYEGWTRMLREMPEVEPSFCIEADGISETLVISRTQSLKMLGNSVVPQQVAAALTVLWNRMVNA